VASGRKVRRADDSASRIRATDTGSVESAHSTTPAAPASQGAARLRRRATEAPTRRSVQAMGLTRRSSSFERRKNTQGIIARGTGAAKMAP
jgi:hypothetical protein